MTGQFQRESPFSYACDHYMDTVYRVAVHNAPSPEDAEEVVSDVFLAAWNQSSDLKAGHVKGWLGAVARNTAKNKLRRTGHTIPLEESFLELPGPDDLTESAARMEEEAAVRQAMNSLPAQEREIFLRHYYYAQPVKEIALRMAMNESTVKTKLRRGRLKLKERLTREGAGS